MKNSKVWGETRLIYKNDNFEVHRIKIVQDGFCSKHRHEFKNNLFFVESGALQIRVWKNDYDLIDKTVLGKFERMNVKPNELHQFLAIKETIAYEVYWSEPISQDIIRESVGGICGQDNKKL